jgi:AbrB family looped-hinge helix DNA binding protein
LSVNGQGRVTIPAQLRRELGIEPGSPMIAYVDDGRLILEPRAHLIARIQRSARASRTGHGSVVDELIADRRAEATRERGETGAGR